MIEEKIESIKRIAKIYGATEDDYIVRNNTTDEAFTKGLAYFGIISNDEDATGKYHDFSIVIFPSKDEKETWLIALGVGSSGFKNDYELASTPGLRRLFTRLINHPEIGYVKSDFSDIESELPKEVLNREEFSKFKKVLLKTGYGTVLPAFMLFDPNDPNDQNDQIINNFIAAYAKIREWPKTKAQKADLSKALQNFKIPNQQNHETEIKELLTQRKYIVLQGPPGTGKTRMAKKIADTIGAKTFFTQFHAETSYSDFIYGIRPDLNSDVLIYKENLGIFVKAIQCAQSNVNTNVVLIIDEINRANLSNVLGPVFYLFEHKMDNANVEIEITPNFKIKKLPDNFYVIASMNTADRSLAVVDFALRRRFAWISLKPNPINGTKTRLIDTTVIDIGNSNYFFKEDFNSISEIFDWYATSTELNLQPGQGYFIAKDEKEMENRIRYEIFPLIKEYLQEGMMKSATEEFNNYFIKRIKQSLFE